MSHTSSTTSPVTRETCAHVSDKGRRSIIVTISGGLLVMRAKGLRTREVADIASIYTTAVKARVIAERAAKKAKRKAAKR